MENNIRQLLTEMEQFLNGKDCSDSGYFRRLAEAYAEASSGVNAALRECRKLIDNGNARQALLLNGKSSPSLTERARILLFPGRPKWVELCGLYHVTTPQEPDMALIEQLESGEFSDSVEQNSDLIDQWRVVARRGTNHEKILLLRKLQKKDNSTNIWRKNLETAERAWIREMLNAAAAAQKHHDDGCLDGIIRQLNSPELLHPVHPSELEPFMQDVHNYRLGQMKEQEKRQLAEIEQAYAAEDLEALGKALCTWSALAQDPLFTPPDPQDADLIAQAEEHFQHKQEEMLLQQRSGELHRKIEELLLRNAPAVELEEAWTQLETLKTPIDPELEKRYSDKEKEFQTAQIRAARQKAVFWSVGVILFCATVALTFYMLNRWHIKQAVCRQMTGFLQKQTPQDALRYYETLKQRKDPVVRDTDVLALFKKAENMQEEQKSQSASVARRIEQLKLNLNAGRAEGCQELIDESAKRFHTQEQQLALELLTQRYKALLQTMQQKRDEAFLQKFRTLQSSGQKLARLAATYEGLNLPELQREYKILETQWRNASTAGISPDLLKRNSTLAVDILKAVKEKIQDAAAYLTLRQTLYAPANAVAYLEALDKIPSLPVFSPQLSKEFAEALRTKDMERLYMNFKFDKKNAKSADLFSQHPYARDLLFVQLDPDAMKNFKNDLGKLKDEAKAWNLYEITMPSGGRNFYFYLQGPLNEDNLNIYRAKGRAGGGYRDMRISVCQPGSRMVDLVFFIISKQKDTYTLILKNPPPGLPEQFDGIPFAQLKIWAERKNIGKALHYEMFMETLNRLGAIQDAENLRAAILKEIRFYSSNNRCNPQARVKIIRSLLKLYGSFSELDRTFANLAESKISGFPADPADWNADAEKTEKNLAYFNSPEFEKLQQTRQKTAQLYKNLLNGMLPNPCGVVYREKDKVRIHCFYKQFQSARCFIYLQGKKGFNRFYLLPDSLMKDKSMPANQLEPDLQYLENGTIFHSVLQYSMDEMRCKPEEVYSVPASIPANLQSKP